jgi:hypothetical protein
MRGGVMAGIWTWTRIDLRRRWRAVVALCLLIAAAGTVAMTSLAGAIRGITALDRLLARTTPIDAVVLANTPGFDWSPFDQLPYVRSRAGFILNASGGAFRELSGTLGAESGDFPHADDRLFFEFDQPIVYAGRMYRPDAVEAVVTPDFVKNLGFGVGDVLHLRLPSPEQIDGGVSDLAYGDLKGPELEVPIVGEVRSSWLLDEPSGSGGISVSPAVVEAYPKSFYGEGGTDAYMVNSQFSLVHGRADVPRLRADVARLTGRNDIDVWDWHQNAVDYDEQLTFEGRALQAFSLAATIAAVFLLGQAIARFAGSAAADLRTAVALGMTPRQVTVGAASTAMIAGVVGASLAVAASAIASARFPVGTAAHVEPDPGISMNWTVLGIGAAVIVVGVAVAAAVGSWTASRDEAAGRVPRVSVLAASLARASAPVPAVVGTRFALERGGGSSALPVRAALAGAVAGLLGVSAVAVFSSGLADAASHPERFGETYQLGGFGGFNGQDSFPPETLVDAATTVSGVTGIVDARVDVANLAGGDGSVELFAYGSSPQKPFPTVVLEGRMPETADEVAVTPGSLEAAGATLHGTIAVDTPTGPHTLKVVGTTFVPQGPHNDYNQGGWITPNGFQALFGDGFKYHLYYLSTDPSAGSVQTIADQINAQLARIDPAFADEPAVIDASAFGTGSTMRRLRQVRTLPLALAVFLALLAVGTVGHALATAVRRRAYQLAVLRAVGMTPWQARLVVIIQATVLILVGVVFGVPLGLAAGRTTWRSVAAFTPLQYVAPTALVVLALVGPVALLIAYAFATWPAVRASRLRVAAILRAE